MSSFSIFLSATSNSYTFETTCSNGYNGYCSANSSNDYDILTFACSSYNSTTSSDSVPKRGDSHSEVSFFSSYVALLTYRTNVLSVCDTLVGKSFKFGATTLASSFFGLASFSSSFDFQGNISSTRRFSFFTVSHFSWPVKAAFRFLSYTLKFRERQK